MEKIRPIRRSRLGGTEGVSINRLTGPPGNNPVLFAMFYRHKLFIKSVFSQEGTDLIQNWWPPFSVCKMTPVLSAAARHNLTNRGNSAALYSSSGVHDALFTPSSDPGPGNVSWMRLALFITVPDIWSHDYISTDVT